MELSAMPWYDPEDRSMPVISPPEQCEQFVRGCIEFSIGI